MESRVTVVEMVYHQNEGMDPVSFPSQYSKRIEGDDESYHRRMKVGTEWRSLNEGSWVRSASLVLIRNVTGDNRSTIPTPQEVVDVQKCILEIKGSDDAKALIYIPPGESCRFRPSDLSDLVIRSMYANTICVMTIIPE